MNWKMTVPCDNCPFRKEGGIRLRKARIREIAKLMLDRQGGTFPCHKSVDYSEERSRDGDVHCAGALLFAEKNGNATQMMRIAERLELYDHRKLSDEHKAQVWDSMGQWLKASDAMPGG